MYSEKDAIAIIRKHQHKVTQHRVDVLLFLMRHQRAFTLKSLAEEFQETIDRATIYRILTTYVNSDIVTKAINERSRTCFFLHQHVKESPNPNAYLECLDCDQIFSLPDYPKQYLSMLNSHQTTPLNTLLKGYCNTAECLARHNTTA